MIGWLIKTVLTSLGLIIVGHRIYHILLTRFTTPKTEAYVLCDTVIGERKLFEGQPPPIVRPQCQEPQSVPDVPVVAVPTMQDELTSFLLDEKLNNTPAETS
jgi:hypothetical protein